MKVLVIVSDRTVPTVTGTRVRNHYLWPAVQSLGVQIKVVGIDRAPANESPSSSFDIDAQFLKFKRENFFKRLWFSLTKSFHEWPKSEQLIEQIKSISVEWKPDIIHAEEMRMAAYLPCIQGYKTKAKQTVTFHNVESDLIKKTGSSPFKFGKFIIEKLHQYSLRKFEKKVVHNADACFAYSEVDLSRYKSLYPSGNWELTKNGTNASALEVMQQTAEPIVLIVGSLSYAPNIKGLNWFLEEVLPNLPSSYKVIVAGSSASQAYKNKLNTYSIEFIDTPLSLDKIFQRCAVCAVPVFEGSGTRGKILESLANERLVITTKIGSEGLNLSEKEGVVTTNSKNEFVSAITIYIKDQKLRNKLASEGRKYVLKNYDWVVVAKQLKTSWESLCVY